MRRWISLVLTVAMLTPATASFAEGAMASWLSPQPGQIVSGGRVEVAIGYNTQSKLKVSSLELYVDGQLLVSKELRVPESRGVCSFSWDTTRIAQGTHNLVVKVFAGDQMISKVYGTGTVGPNGSSRGMLDVRPPVVTFANIRAGDVLKGTTTIKLNAVDDSGQSPMVSLLVDDVLKLLKNTPPYSYDLDTKTYADGDHALKTYAYDGAGNRSDPAVVKVAFKNGASKPVVTTLSVNHSPEDDVATAAVSSAIPPSVSASADSSIRKSAARAQTRIEAPTSPVAPVVAEARVKPRMIAMAPKPVASPRHEMAAAKLVSSLRTVQVAGKSELRPTHSSPKLDSRMAAAVPVVKIAAAHRSEPALSSKPVRMASVSTSAQVRKEAVRSAEGSFSPLSAAPKIAEPKPAVAAPKSSGVARMVMAVPSPLLRGDHHAVASGALAASAPKIVDPPVVSGVLNVPVKQATAIMKTANAPAVMADAATASAPKILAPAKISKTDLKRVRVAMAPDLRSATEGMHASPAIAVPPAIVKPTKARIEKTTMPAKGKVKARSFFQNMGGVLFWDPSTHTVTACVGNMVMEMKIGSKSAKVNGHEFEMATAPFLANNRTVFDAGSFAQACALVNSLKTVSQAEVL